MTCYTKFFLFLIRPKLKPHSLLISVIAACPQYFWFFKKDSRQAGMTNCVVLLMNSLVSRRIPFFLFFLQFFLFCFSLPVRLSSRSLLEITNGSSNASANLGQSPSPKKDENYDKYDDDFQISLLSYSCFMTTQISF